MEFRFTFEEESFREELRDFLKQELPDGWPSIADEYEEES